MRHTKEKNNYTFINANIQVINTILKINQGQQTKSKVQILFIKIFMTLLKNFGMKKYPSAHLAGVTMISAQSFKKVLFSDSPSAIGL